MNRAAGTLSGGGATGGSALRETVVLELLVKGGLTDLEARRELGPREVGVDFERLVQPASLGLLEQRGQAGRQVGRRGRALAAVETRQDLGGRDGHARVPQREPRGELLQVSHVARPGEVELAEAS